MAAICWTKIASLLVCQIVVFSPTITGEYGSWSQWSECPKTCNGEQTRTRQCIRSSAECNKELLETRDCGRASWNSGCFSQGIIIALALIGAAILVTIIISIILCGRNRKEREKNQLQEVKNMTETIERRYDNAVPNPLYKGTSSVGRLPSLSSFPDPLKEPEEMDLDNFAFDQESLNESIQSITFAFGTDEEFQPGKAPKKEEEKPMALKVVSVTETQVIDRDNVGQGMSNDEKPKQDKPPIYAVVVKPKKDAQPNLGDAGMY